VKCGKTGCIAISGSYIELMDKRDENVKVKITWTETLKNGIKENTGPKTPLKYLNDFL
jgi:hypothetical protein